MTVDENGHAPVIINSFASKEVSYGETWDIYLQAQDADGDMKQIVCHLDEPGYGPHPITFIRIREKQRRILSGFIYLSTRIEFGFGFANLLLTVQIQDSKGHYSNAVSFPVTLNPRATQQTPPPGIFQEEELGPIQISIAATPGP
jgi:hypothetical protein